jgi:arylsulfatase A-like enzyme
MKFARSATLFRQAYNAAPTCSPSRAALLTGISPHENGMLGLAHIGFQLNDYSKHLCSFLKTNGFKTVLCGIQHVAPDYRMIGYDVVLGSQSFNMGDTINSMESFDHSNTKEACNYISSRAGKAEPFFLSFGLFNTHREFPTPQDTGAADYIVPPPVLYDCDMNRRDMAGFIESVRVVDECFGSLLSAVDEAGLADDTMIIMTTDHGIAFPHMKCTLYDAGGVALLVRLPKKYNQIKATDALVSQLDLFPTICEAAGLEPPAWLEGKSLMPLITGQTDHVRDEIFAEVTYHAAYEPQRCIRTDRYKLIRRYDYHNGPVPANVDDCLSKSFLIENGYLENTAKAREYLFDLWLDPLERENLAENPKYKGIYDDLSLRLESWMISTKDPLITHGSRVPRPEGAKVVRLEITSPRSTEYED